MAGPIPPHQQAGAEGEPYPEQPFGPPGAMPPVPYPGVYPGALPPPVAYPPAPRKRRTALWLGLLTVVVVAGVVAAVLTIRTGESTPAAGGFTEAGAKSSITSYLTALSKGDTETIARNNLCGMYDGVKDRKSDLALAKLASDAFRRQFAGAEVSSIDAIVPWSSHQAQVLFTMKVASSGSRGSRGEEQGVAQLLRQGNQLLVCSYLLRTAAQY
ncbi:Rv0361 family membrane protein [Mycolicibacterium rhodesiae]|uniref:DUF8174 domain-containing protein n=1 Tax=Mycolicibacterium rhodesiae TaxID=36814 RepID=A0A1X0ILC4_MYCRH|nr:hypothetical protein [Mycolicibacterium rhodesiae]MCV7347135.1 hypothetical protein [Mycolicibacterium rhodesiae]ORB48860.1 hypothetical protein BST42_24285 [Mycolicibacterium rhodesiae]